MTENWLDRAACRLAKPGLFDALSVAERRVCGAQPDGLARVQQARAICRTCPVMAACDEYAEAIQAEGVWADRYRRTVPTAKARRAA